MSLKENSDAAYNSAPLRLQVYLAHAGIASRRTAEKFISQGRVTVNGRLVSTMGEKVLPSDEVCFDGKQVKIQKQMLYMVLNKPPMYICSSFDPQGRALAIDLLPPLQTRLYNIGRLDYRSSGLIIFTNDGEFAAWAGHPSSCLEKEYLVDSTVPIPDRIVQDFTNGIMIENVLYKALSVEKTGKFSLKIVLVEGKNREIRKVFSHFRLHPEKLQRVRIGPITIENLSEGQSRPLTNDELLSFSKLKQAWE